MLLGYLGSKMKKIEKIEGLCAVRFQEYGYPVGSLILIYDIKYDNRCIVLLTLHVYFSH